MLKKMVPTSLLMVLISSVLILGLSIPVQTVSAQGNNDDLVAALDWLESQLQEDGGFSNGFAPESDVGTTADAVLAFVVAGRDPNEILTSSGISPLDFLREWANSEEDAGAGVSAKVAFAVKTAGLNPDTFADRNLSNLILKGYDPESGLFGSGSFDSALAILALVSSGVELPEGAVDLLIDTRLEDGSFSFALDPTLVTGDSNTTAIVVQALIAAGAEAEIGASIDYFRNTQNEDGGWTYQKPSEFGEETDSNSTALVIQALQAAGEDLEQWGNPITVLSTLQEPSGAFGYSASFGGDNILATIQVIPTLAGANYVDPFPPQVIQSEASQKVIIGVLILLVLVLGTVILLNRGGTASERE